MQSSAHDAIIRQRQSRRVESVARGGFTLVEVLVAVVLVNVGLLALVAGSAVLVRRGNVAHARASAVRAASNRIEKLGVGGCASVSGESVAVNGIRERWSAIPIGIGTRELRDSVQFSADGAMHTVTLWTRLQC
ncbi:MAG TPA: prepilin-type N-terminal cleavage/methylation domain-containing protein [Gemmatimonadaceae bacterium]|jgi:Tfp pilus assembly protein PilV|nr:prepilin-type N-terminal cleavage/methylation domain-containing protein [Gemmatimonadaceae bacterium]